MPPIQPIILILIPGVTYHLITVQKKILGHDKAGLEAEGRTAPLVAEFVKAFTAAKQAASNDHEGTATSSQ